MAAGLVGRVARDVALALAVTEQIQTFGPILPHRHLLPTAESISGGIVPERPNAAAPRRPRPIGDGWARFPASRIDALHGQSSGQEVRQLLPGRLRMLVASAARRRSPRPDPGDRPRQACARRLSAVPGTGLPHAPRWPALAFD